jgi:DUF4097 and DUF4098 domain-containing protein YvlB
MATLPPPYSPRDAARAQRYYQRSLRRPSFIGPIVLLVAGILALLVETNKLDGVLLLDWYMRWWPLLLIAVGLLSLGEWWLDRRHAQLGGRSHGGLVVLIVVLALVGYLAGSASHRLHGMHVFGHDEGDDMFSRLLGQEHDTDSTLNESIPAGAQIEIQVPHGDVTVTTSGDSQVHVQAHQVVYAANDHEARRNLEALTPKLVVNGNHVTLRAANGNDGRADLTIEIPRDAVPTINAGHGDVTIEGLPKGSDTTVNAGRGDVKLDNLAGAVQVHMAKGDFTAHGLGSDLALSGRMDDVSISEVQGRVALDGDFFGDTDVAHVASAVHFHSSRTDVEVGSLPGDLSIDSGDLQLNNAVGPARLSTSAKDVECTGIQGDLRVEAGDGDITIGAVAPLGALQIHNRNGEIHLTVPRGASFSLQALAKNGDIDTDLKLPVTSVGEGHSIQGQVGSGGPQVALTTDHGDLEIRAIDAATEPPAPPAPPQPPQTPAAPGSKPLRHLHPVNGAEPHPVSQ